jgi:leader peptidase (prepilin peptidase) / N-methyltransferase
VSFGLRLYFDFIVFLFGACAGSFFNVCIHRMPREESIVNPPSHCPKCNQRIQWYDNIPLVSFLLLRGKCRHCGTAISPRYLFIELLTASLFLAVWLKYEFLWVAPIYWVLVGGLIVSTFIDFEHYIIPNEITYGGILAGLALSLLCPPLHEVENIGASVLRSLLGGFTGGATLLVIAMVGEKIFKKEAMGMGDVKFIAGIGAFLGWQAALFTIFASSVIGGVVGLLLVVTSKKGWGSRIPYGPYIALAALLWVFFGRELINWYFGFLQS